jgi:hypothetical protein
VRVGLIALLALAGCGGAAAPPPTPAGFTRFTGKGFTFDHPAGWTKETPQRGVVGFYGTGAFPPQVAVGVGAAHNDLDAVVRLHKETQKIRFPSYRVHAEREVAHGHVIDATYRVKGAVLHEIDLLVQTQDGRQLDFFVRAPVGVDLRTVFNSFRLT